EGGAGDVDLGRGPETGEDGEQESAWMGGKVGGRPGYREKISMGGKWEGSWPSRREADMVWEGSGALGAGSMPLPPDGPKRASVKGKLGKAARPGKKPAQCFGRDWSGLDVAAGPSSGLRDHTRGHNTHRGVQRKKSGGQLQLGAERQSTNLGLGHCGDVLSESHSSTSTTVSQGRPAWTERYGIHRRGWYGDAVEIWGEHGRALEEPDVRASSEPGRGAGILESWTVEEGKGEGGRAQWSNERLDPGGKDRLMLQEEANEVVMLGGDSLFDGTLLDLINDIEGQEDQPFRHADYMSKHHLDEWDVQANPDPSSSRGTSLG
ncbi:unnamed protein product, partial [Discosporangium mesarthrocarpum]